MTEEEKVQTENYLESMKAGLEDYKNSIVRHLGVMKQSMDRQRDQLMNQIQKEVNLINNNLNKIRNEESFSVPVVEEKPTPETTTEKIDRTKLREVLNQMKIIIQSIEEKI